MQSSNSPFYNAQSRLLFDLLAGKPAYEKALSDYFHSFVEESESTYGYLGKTDQDHKVHSASFSTFRWKGEDMEQLQNTPFFPIEDEIRRALNNREHEVRIQKLDGSAGPASLLIFTLRDKQAVTGILCLIREGQPYSTEAIRKIKSYLPVMTQLTDKCGKCFLTIPQHNRPLAHWMWESSAILKGIVQMVGLGMWILALDERKIYCSESLYDLLQSPPPPKIPDLDDMTILIPEQERRAFLVALLKAQKEGSRQTLNHHFILPSGEQIAVETYIQSFTYDSSDKRYLIGVSHDITKVQNEEKKKQCFDDILLELSKEQTLQEAHIDAFLKKLLRLGAEALKVARLSIWTFNDNYDRIDCSMLYERKKDCFTQGSVLKVKDAPHYFEAILESRTLAAHDARKDPRTKEFTDPYFIDLDIYSLLDSQVRQAGEIKGVICAENTGCVRQWTENEENFVASLSSFISLAFSRRDRKESEEASKRAERKYRTLFENTPIPLILTDNRTHAIIDVNQAAEREYGYSFHEFTNLNLIDIRPASEQEKLRKKLLEPRPVYERAGVWIHQRKDKSLFFADVIVHKVELEGLSYSIIHVQNISEQIEAKQKNDTLIKQLGEFATLTAHELRGPLARILGLVSIFNSKKADDPTNAEVIKRLKIESSQLDQVIYRMMRTTEKDMKKNQKLDN